MAKKQVLVIISMLIGTTLFAQKDPAAKKVLDAVSAKVKTFKGIKADFSIKSFSSKGKANGVKTGNIVIKNQKYLLKQGKTEIICDGKTIWNFDGSKTITVSPADESNQTLSPQNLLSNFYDKDFNYKLIPGTGNFNEVELTPIDKKKSFKTVTVFIDKAKNMITKALILDLSSNKVEFSLNNLNTTEPVQDNLFIFNKAKYPKDVEILD